MLLGIRLATLGLAVAVQSALARTLLPADRGAYALVTSVAVFLCMASTASVHHGAQYEILTKKTSPSQGMSAALAISVVGSLLAAAVAVPVVLAVVGASGDANERTFLLALTVMPLYAFTTTANGLLLAFSRFGAMGLVELVMAFFQLAGTLLLAGQLALGVDGAVVAFTACVAVGGVLAVGFLRLKCGVALQAPTRAGLLAVLRYGRKIHVANICEFLEPRIGILVLWLLASSAEVGFFAAASVLAVGMYALPAAFSGALLPRITGADQSQPFLVAFSLRIVGWAAALGVLALFAARGPFVRTVLGDEFLPVVSLVPALGPGMVAGALSIVVVAYLKAEGRPELPSYAALIQVASMTFLTFLLYPRMGLVGAAWALSIALVARGLFLLAFFCRLSGEAWTSAWRLRRADLAMLRQGVLAMAPRRVRG